MAPVVENGVVRQSRTTPNNCVLKLASIWVLMASGQTSGASGALQGLRDSRRALGQERVKIIMALSVDYRSSYQQKRPRNNLSSKGLQSDACRQLPTSTITSMHYRSRLMAISIYRLAKVRVFCETWCVVKKMFGCQWKILFFVFV